MRREQNLSSIVQILAGIPQGLPFSLSSTHCFAVSSQFLNIDDNSATIISEVAFTQLLKYIHSLEGWMSICYMQPNPIKTEEIFF